jgi:cytochrome c556
MRSAMALLLVALGTAVAFAATVQTGPTAARARRDNFDALLSADRVLRDQLGSSNPDLKAIRQASGRMHELAAQLPSWFPPGSGPESGAPTHAKPEIWQNPADFRRRQLALLAAVSQLDAAARAGELTKVRTARSETSEACRGCHETYEDRF